MKEWENLYNVTYSEEEILEFKNLDYPVMRVRNSPIPTIVDYAAIQDEYFNSAYEQNEKSTITPKSRWNWRNWCFLV